MLIDKKRRLIAVPAKRRIKNYSSTHGGGTAEFLYRNFDVSKYNFVKSENTNCNFCGKTAVYA